MAIFALTDCRLVFGPYDFTGVSNRADAEASVAVVDDTTFGTNGWRSRRGGLKEMVATMGGFVDFGAGKVDPVMFDNLGATSVASMLASATGDDGDIAYIWEPIDLAYQPGATVGEMAAWQATVHRRGQYAAVRGTILHDDAAARTATGNGTGRQLGDVAGTEKLYAALHVIDVSGTTPSLTVKVQSDDNSGFATPTDRITFTAATAVTSQWATPVSPTITDTWWRITYTISGTSPSFKFFAVVGIQ